MVETVFVWWDFKGIQAEDNSLKGYFNDIIYYTCSEMHVITTFLLTLTT